MMSDVATRPTSAIAAKESMAALAAQATTPLPRASGSMAPPPGVQAPAKPAARPRPVPKKKKSRAPLLIGLVLVLAGAGLGAYLAFPAQVRQILRLGPSADSLAHARQLAEADSLARHRTDSLAKVAADSARTESTRVAAREKPKGGRRGEEVAVAPQSTHVDCESPTTSRQNPGHACWDSPANPRSAPLVRPPASCTGSPGSVNIMVHVSATGEVMGQPTVMGRSSCAAFDDAAAALVAGMAFDPAQKHGAGVVTWQYVLVRPLPH